MKDFTLTTYRKLLQELLASGYSFQTLENFIKHPNKEKIVILRHDVDRKPENALVVAAIEKEAGGRRSEVRCQKSEITPVEHPGRGPGSTGQGGRRK